VRTDFCAIRLNHNTTRPHLFLEHALQVRLATKFQVKAKGRSMKRIQRISTVIILSSGTVHTSDVAMILGFEGRPRRSFQVKSREAALTTPTISLKAVVTRQCLKGFRHVFHKQAIAVILGDPTVLTSTAGEGCCTRSGVDNHSLSLGRCPNPEIDIMSSVTLEELRDRSGIIGGGQATRVTTGTVKNNFFWNPPLFSHYTPLMHRVRHQRDREDVFQTLPISSRDSSDGE
jgi:hypothetical protein